MNSLATHKRILKKEKKRQKAPFLLEEMFMLGRIQVGYRRIEKSNPPFKDNMQDPHSMTRARSAGEARGDFSIRQE